MLRALPTAAILLLLAGCGSVSQGNTAASATTFASAQHPSEIRDCVVQAGARSGVPIGDFTYTLDGGFRYAAQSGVVVEVAEEKPGSRIRLSGPAQGALSEIVRGCS